MLLCRSLILFCIKIKVLFVVCSFFLLVEIWQKVAKWSPYNLVQLTYNNTGSIDSI